MMSRKKFFSMKEITRRELPAYERHGVIAQEVAGPELLFIIMHQTRTDLETAGEMAAEVPQGLREARSGVSDTVLVGSVSGAGTAPLVDILMLERKSHRGKPWKERLKTLCSLHSRLPEDVQAKYPLAREWNRGLLRAFDEVVGDGGLGLLLRVDGKAQAVLCSRR